MSVLSLLTVFGVRDDSVCLDGYWKHTELSSFRKRIWKLRIRDRHFRQKAIKLICTVFWPRR